MKKTIGITVLVALALSIVLAGCNAVGTLINPIIGSWNTTIIAVSVTETYNADGKCTEVNSLGSLGTTRSGTWDSDSTTLTKTWADDSVSRYTYSFNADKTTMTLVPESGVLSLTYNRQ